MLSDAGARWQIGIGDPTALGWLTVLGYLTALIGALACARRASAKKEFHFWVVSCALLLCLGLNKQLDLQTLFTQTGRDVAFAQGWYSSRRTVQFVFIAILGIMALLVAAWMRSAFRQAPRTTRLAGAGMVLILVFVLLRGASFHHFDQVLGLSFDGFIVHRILELAAVSLVAAGAFARYLGLRGAAMTRLNRTAVGASISGSINKNKKKVITR